MANKADNTRKKQLPKPLVDNQWKKGESGNPNGRPKGSRSALSETFLKDMLVDFEANGKEAIQKVRENDPSTYIRVVASIVPKEFTINEGESAIERILNSVNDTELAGFVEGVRLLTVATTGGKGANKEGSTIEPDKFH